MNIRKKLPYIYFLKSYACKRKLLLLYSIIITIIIINTGNSLFRPQLQGRIVDDLSDISNIYYDVISMNVIIFLGLLITNFILLYLQRYLATVISEEIASDIRQKIHDKLSTVKTKFFDKFELSDILLKVDKDILELNQCGITSIITLISNIAIVIVILPYMLSINKYIGIINFILLISVPFISRLLGKTIQKISEQVLFGYNDITSTLTETYHNWFVIRLFRCGEYVHKKFSFYSG